MNEAASLEILIQIRDELAGLNRTRAGLREGAKEARGFGAAIREGLGVGSGMEIARRGIDLLTGSIRASIGQAFRLAEEIKDGSESLQISAEAYQVVKFELAQAGVEMGRFSMAINEQTQSLAAARSGAGAAAEAYKALGLSAAQLEQMSPEQRAIAVAHAVLGATDQTKAFQAAGQILGTRGLPQLLNGLKNLATEGYDKIAKAARDAGRILEEETVAMIDRNKKLWANFKDTTLPVATGSLVGLAQSGMDWLGAAVGNAVNFAQGLPQGSREGMYVTPGAKTPGSGGTVGFDTGDNIQAARMADIQQRAAQVNGALVTEHQKRALLLPILAEQEKLYSQIAEAQGGKGWQLSLQNLRVQAEAGTLTEEQVAQYKKLAELEGKIADTRQQRLQNIDTPLAALNAELLDTTGLIANTLQNSVGGAISSLSSNIWGAFQGTAKWGDSFRGLGQIAGQVLTELMVKLLVVRPLLSMFGVGGDTPGGSSIFGASKVKAAGGGSFVTSGPTNFTVGDNPGGMELVSVLPLSGIGQSSVNGQALRMAGGGSALVSGGARAGAGGGAPVTVNFNFATGVAATVRAEVLGMASQLRELAVDAVQEAHMRNRLRIA